MIRHLSLVKGEHRFIFRYKDGDEATLIDSFAALANDQSSHFDWFDAAVLSYQLGRRLADQCKRHKTRESGNKEYLRGQ